MGILKRLSSMPVPVRLFWHASLVPKRSFGLACHREARAHSRSSKPQSPALFPKSSVLSVFHGSSNASTQPIVRADAQRQAATGPHFILGLARPAVARRSTQTLGCSKCKARKLRFWSHAQARRQSARAAIHVRSGIGGTAGNRGAHFVQLGQVEQRKSVNGSRSARQCCAWQTVRGCCRLGGNRLRSRQLRARTS